MGAASIFSIIIVGASGIIAQVVLLRELLVSFYGNELTFGIMLANWVLLEALGVFAAGRAVDKVKSGAKLFIALELVFLAAFGLSAYLARTFKGILGISFGLAHSTGAVFWASLFIMSAPASSHGALFAASCRLFPPGKPQAAATKAYAFETIGTAAGGFLLTYLLIPYLHPFRIIFIAVAVNLAACLIIAPANRRYALTYPLVIIAALAFAAFFSGGVDFIQRLSAEIQYPGQQVLAYRNSVYGQIAVTLKDRQKTFYYNGLPLITTPHPDTAQAEEFGHLPILFSKGSGSVLIIGAGSGGLLNEVLKHPVKNVYYAELDPGIIKAVRDYPSDLTCRELADERLRVINSDGRFYLKNSRMRYDVILVGFSAPSDLATNRFFTQEFFALAAKRLTPGGVLAFRLPGCEAYLSDELKDLNNSVLAGLKKTFASVRAVPGDCNLFLASNLAGGLDASSAEIASRLKEQNISTTLLVPAYLDYRLDRARADSFIRLVSAKTAGANRDLRPFAVFASHKLYSKEFSPRLFYFLRPLEKLTAAQLAVFIALLTPWLRYFIRRRPDALKAQAAYGIFTTGFAGMLGSLMLIFAFQAFYGYLYRSMGILIGIFMAGIASGSMLFPRLRQGRQSPAGLFMKLEIAVFLFLAGLALLIDNYSGWHSVLFFILGFLTGLEFSAAVRLWAPPENSGGRAAAALYFSDLAGGWLAGIAGGTLFLPLFGATGALAIAAALKLSSLFVIMPAAKK